MNKMDAFAVIADPTRRRILDTLRDGAADVGTLVARLGISAVLAWVTPYHREWSSSLDRLSELVTAASRDEDEEEQS